MVTSLMNFFTNEFQALQHRWKKGADYQSDNIWKIDLIGHI